MMIAEAIEKFIFSRKLLGCTLKTVDDYTQFLNKFNYWLSSHGYYLTSELTVNVFNEYVEHLLSRNIKRVTVRTYLTHVRALYHWLQEEEYININLSKLKLPKKADNIIEVLTDYEIKLLYSSLIGEDFLEVRNRLIISCMLDCGFRRSDIVNLKTEDIKDGYFILNGKGNKQRIVPYGDRVLELIKEYQRFKYYREYFFILEDGQRITENAVKMLFQRLKTKTGIKRLKAHLLRHTFATNYLYLGGNLEVLRLILGHTDIRTTQIYLHLAETKKLLQAKHISYLDTLI